MKKLFCILLIILCIPLTSCRNNKDIGIIGGSDGPTSILISEKGEKQMYEIISPKKAKEIMDTKKDIVILDVREQEEYDDGHIKGAILIPYTEIETVAEKTIPDKSKEILVYCRSGRRSKIASQSLVKIGYTNVKEFGGIIDWPYDVEK